jgi:dihydroorotate dehydrogenase electron transfer subunit
MPERCTSSAKGMFSAIVSSNRQIGQRFYRLKLEFLEEAADVFAGFKPGQFVQLDVYGAALPSTELLYCVVGPSTLRMTTLSSGDTVSMIGPLGNGFKLLNGKKTAVLIVGGMGVPPLQHLAQAITSKYPGIEVTAFAGAKTATELPFEGRLDEISQQLGFSLPEFAKYGIESLVATDDGSVGYHGLVTDCFIQWLEQSDASPDDMIIYGCGPEPMLARLAEIAEERNIDCQISMERRMACGIGLCQSCVIECKVDGSNESVYKLCCEDGPVFDSREVVFS